MNRYNIQFSKQAKILLLLLFGFFIFGLFRISYQKREALLFYQNQQEKIDLLYQIFDTKPIKASSIYVYDFSDHKEIYSKRADEKKGIASLSKLMTALTSSDFIKDKKIVIIPGMIIHNEETYFSLGQIWDTQEIEKIMLVASSNNAAEILAQVTEKNNNKSPIDIMNSLAKKYFLEDTYFNNPTGLDEDDVVTTNISTAKNVNQLAYLLYRKVPEVVDATTKKTYTTKSLSGKRISFLNTNQSVDLIEELLLSKTGYTVQSGGNLTVLYKSKYNKHIVGITVLDSTRDGRFDDIISLVNATDLYLELLNSRKISEF